MKPEDVCRSLENQDIFVTQRLIRSLAAGESSLRFFNVMKFLFQQDSERNLKLALVGFNTGVE